MSDVQTIQIQNQTAAVEIQAQTLQHQVVYAPVTTRIGKSDTEATINGITNTVVAPDQADNIMQQRGKSVEECSADTGAGAVTDKAAANVNKDSTQSGMVAGRFGGNNAGAASNTVHIRPEPAGESVTRTSQTLTVSHTSLYRSSSSNKLRLGLIGMRLR